jgi:hypothetical protein
MGPLCPRVLRVHGDAVPARRTAGPGGHGGNTHGVKPRGVVFPCSTAIHIVHVLSWHQVQNDHDLGAALQQVKDAGLIPDKTVRLCVICDGAEWIGKHVQTLFPHACQVLDSSHGSEYLHKVAKAHYGNSAQAQEWVEATLTRLSLGQVGQVLGGLRRMQPPSEDALKAIDNCWIDLGEHRGRTTYRQFRRGGYPLGSGGMESSNTCICHVRLKRSGAWWYEVNSHQMLARRCAKYNGTFHQVFARYQRQKSEA